MTVLKILLVKLVVVTTSPLFSYDVFSGISIVPSLSSIPLSTIEDCAEYCGDSQECVGFSFNSVNSFCIPFIASDKYIWYSNFSLYMKANSCGQNIIGSDYLQAWSEWGAFSSCNFTCGMFGMQTSTRSWIADPMMYDATVYGSTENSVACPSIPCTGQQCTCNNGYKKGIPPGVRAFACIPDPTYIEGISKPSCNFTATTTTKP